MHKVARLPSEFTERATNGADKPKHRRKTVEPKPSVPRLISRSLAMGALTTPAATYVIPTLMETMAAKAVSSFHP
jgi:hypothetical protein